MKNTRSQNLIIIIYWLTSDWDVMEIESKFFLNIFSWWWITSERSISITHWDMGFDDLHYIRHFAGILKSRTFSISSVISQHESSNAYLMDITEIIICSTLSAYNTVLYNFVWKIPMRCSQTNLIVSTEKYTVLNKLIENCPHIRTSPVRGEAHFRILQNTIAIFAKTLEVCIWQSINERKILFTVCCGWKLTSKILYF